MPAGRILLKSISESKKLSKLKTDSARLLYTWLIPHLDINGCFSGDAEVIKGKIFTRLKKSNKTVEGYLQDLERVKLIVRYESNGDIFLHSPDFAKKQPSLNPKKEGKPLIPLPTPELLQNYSRQTLEKVGTSKVKESKVEVKENKDKEIRSENDSPNTHKTKTYKYKENHMIEAKYLESAIKATSPRHVIQGKDYLESWASTFRIMEEKKEADMDEVRFVIDFAMRDKFWYKNILSADKLRKQFGRLWEDVRQEWDKKKHLYVGRNKNEF